MRSSRENNPFKNTMETSLKVALLLFLLSHAFTPKVVKDIKDRAKDTCEGCSRRVGRKNLTAGHIYHSDEEKYNVEENGKAFCDFCEAKHHLKHADNPKEIGLNKKQNDRSTYGWVWKLSEFQRKQLIFLFPQQWSNILKRMHREE